MATAETETSSDERVPPGGSVYDGFISYSHAADDLLAPRLQAGLQRFAKPWWKRRTLRIFRDESSLSANPHLWSSITDALDQSSWFVLLLSPDAAESPWVNNEVEYWLEHKDPDRIIPVLTDGDFGWADRDVRGDAVPPALQGAFSDEPRWVDLRFARTEEQLDLKNPTFSAAIADIASALHGVPKDELASEEVRQHRRTVRTAWAAGFALVALIILATGAAIYALGQQNRANDLAAQEAIARQEAEAAASAEFEARQQAEDSAAAESAARQEADRSADVAKSRELAASAVSVLDENPELSMLLALESIHATPPGANTSPSGVLALRDAIGSNQLLARFPAGDEGASFARISPDGSTVYVWYPPDGTLSAFDVVTGATLWVHREELPVASWGTLAISPTGDLVAIPLLADSAIPEPSWEGEAPGDRLGRIVVLKSEDGRVEAEFETACQWQGIAREGFSPDGRWLMTQTGDENCFVDPSVTWTASYDTTTWEETHRLAIDGEPAIVVSFSAASDRVLMNVWDGPVELRSFPELELIASLGRASSSRISPDGTRAVLVGPASGDQTDIVGIFDLLRPRVIDIASGRQLFFLDAVDDFRYGDDFVFSPDGSKIGVTTRGHDYVFDASNGKLLTDLGEPGTTEAASFTDDGARLLTSTSGSASLWDVGDQIAEVGSPIALEGAEGLWVNSFNQVSEGPNLALRILAFNEPARFITALLDPRTGAVSESIGGQGIQLPDGRFIVTSETPEDDDLRIGPIVIWDPVSGATTELTECSALESAFDYVTPIDCPGGGPMFGDPENEPGVMAASDGSFIAAESYGPAGAPHVVRVWDPDTHEIVAEFEVGGGEFLQEGGPTWTAAQDAFTATIIIRDIPSGEKVAQLGDASMGRTVTFSPNTALLYVADGQGGVWVYDTSSWELVASWEAHGARHRGMAISPDGARLASTAEDNFVKVWDVSGIRDRSSMNEPPPLLDRIPAPKPSDAAWAAQDRLVVFLADGAKWFEVSLVVDDLVADARERLTRSFTVGECATYQIVPCPTLQEIRNR